MLLIKACDIVEQVGQRVCRIFIPAAFLNLAGQVAEQPHITGCMLSQIILWLYIQIKKHMTPPTKILITHKYIFIYNCLIYERFTGACVFL